MLFRSSQAMCILRGDGSGGWRAEGTRGGIFLIPVWICGIVMGVERCVGRMNYTYILRCRDGSLYTGWTNDLEKRVSDHNAGKGAKYTRARRPVELAYFEAFETKEEAMRREYAIKRLPRGKKMELLGEGGVVYRNETK